jgi:hypothetical protein
MQPSQAAQRLGLSPGRSASRRRGGAEAMRRKRCGLVRTQKWHGAYQGQRQDGNRRCTSGQTEHAIEMRGKGRIRRPRVLHRHTARGAAHQRVLHRLDPGRSHRHAQRHAPPQQYTTRQGGGFAQGMQGHGLIMAARSLGTARENTPSDGTAWQHAAATCEDAGA